MTFPSRRRKRLIALLAASACVVMPFARAGWETIRIDGDDYVTVRSIKAFYGFQSMTRQGGSIVLENDAVKIQFTKGGQEVFMNNVKFIFSYPVRAHLNRYLVSRIDLAKLIDPVLRPQYIPTAAPFNTVIIDPGHGGKDSGATNRYNKEKNYSLTLARMLKRELTARQFRVIMTRDSDRYLTLEERVNFANRFSNAIFISLHFNSGGRGRASGIETFTLSPVGVAHYGRGLKDSDFRSRTGNSQDSANIALATAVHSTCLLATGRPDRGIRRARWSVLTGVKHPAILLEGGFMNHSYEARLIHNPSYQKTLSKAIASAVVKFKLATTRRLNTSR